MFTTKMKKEPAWKNNGSGKILQYDFSPPTHWTGEQISIEQMSIASLLRNSEVDKNASAPGWLHLARCLPNGLRSAVIAELQAGNHLIGIGKTGWPNEGSIVANMRNRFSVSRRTLPTGVIWRELNDPHYCREELSEKINAIEFLVIT